MRHSENVYNRVAHCPTSSCTSHRTDLDLLGTGRMPAQCAVPMHVRRSEGCVQCILADQGDNAGIERHIIAARRDNLETVGARLN